MKLIIPTTLHSEVKSHLVGTFPNEGGGFLIGRTIKDRWKVEEVRCVENIFDTEEQYHRYLMEEGAFQAAEDYADERGLTLIGYFHSHPNSPAIPSEYDRVHALPNFVYLILSVQTEGVAESLAWVLEADRSKFMSVEFEEQNIERMSK